MNKLLVAEFRLDSLDGTFHARDFFFQPAPLSFHVYDPFERYKNLDPAHYGTCGFLRLAEIVTDTEIPDLRELSDVCLVSRKDFKRSLVIGFHYDVHQHARRHVRFFTHSSDRRYDFLHKAHLGLDLLVDKACLRFRKLGNGNALALTRIHQTVHLLGNERHEWMEHLEGSFKYGDGIRNNYRASHLDALPGRSLLLVQALFYHLDIPVAVVMPDKIIYNL